MNEDGDRERREVLGNEGETKEMRESVRETFQATSSQRSEVGGFEYGNERGHHRGCLVTLRLPPFLHHLQFYKQISVPFAPQNLQGSKRTRVDICITCNVDQKLDIDIIRDVDIYCQDGHHLPVHSEYAALKNAICSLLQYFWIEHSLF